MLLIRLNASQFVAHYRTTQIWVRRLLETAFPTELKMYSRVQDFPSHPTTFLCAQLKERWIRVSNTVFPKQLIFIADDNIRDIFRLFYSSPILSLQSHSSIPCGARC